MPTVIEVDAPGKTTYEAVHMFSDTWGVYPGANEMAEGCWSLGRRSTPKTGTGPNSWARIKANFGDEPRWARLAKAGTRQAHDLHLAVGMVAGALRRDDPHHRGRAGSAPSARSAAGRTC